MSTNAPSGEISKPPAWGYEGPIGEFAKAINRLVDFWEKGGKSKLEETEEAKPVESKKEEENEAAEEEAQAMEARRIALRKIAARKRAMLAEALTNPKAEEEGLQRKKLEELKSKIEEVKKKVEEAKAKREEAKMEAKVQGKASVGAVSEEKPTGAVPVANLGASDRPLPAYWGELLGASAKFKKEGLLSSG